MSIINAIVGSLCGCVFLMDWIVSRSKSPRALENAKKRAQKHIITDEGYHPMPSDEPTPPSRMVLAMKPEDLQNLEKSLVLVIPIGLLLGYLGTLVVEHFLSKLGTWGYFITTGALIGLGTPAFLQIWALSMDLLCFVRTGSGPMKLPLKESMAETLDISVHEHLMFNPALYMMFVLSGCGCGSIAGAARIVFLNYQAV